MRAAGLRAHRRGLFIIPQTTLREEDSSMNVTARRVISVFAAAVLIAVMACGVLVLAFCTHGFGHVKKRYMVSGKTRQENLLGGNGRRRKQYRILPYAVPVALGTWLVLVTAWHGASLPM